MWSVGYIEQCTLNEMLMHSFKRQKRFYVANEELLTTAIWLNIKFESQQQHDHASAFSNRHRYHFPQHVVKTLMLAKLYKV